MIIFTSLSDVLIKGVEETEKLVRSCYGNRVGFEYSKRLDKTRPEFEQLLRGEITEDAYWKIVLDNQNWPFGLRDIKKILSATLKESIPGVMGVIQDIKSFPSRLPACNAEQIYGSPEICLISNHIMERMEEIKSYHPKVFKTCNKSFWSCEMSSIASDDGFFKSILKINDLSPNEAIYIDVNPFNTTAAVLSGITSIIYTTPSRLKKSLMEYSFTF